MNCTCCGRPTGYTLRSREGAHVPCCGRFRCERRVRDGVDIPPTRDRREPTIETRELVAALQDAVNNGSCPAECAGCWVCRGEQLLELVGA